MRALKALVIAMGVLITGATAALIVLIVLKVTAPPHPIRHAALAPRASAPPAPAAAASVVLGEPAGSHILAMVPTANGLALALGGGGESDRIVVIDPTSGHVLERVRLSH